AVGRARRRRRAGRGSRPCPRRTRRGRRRRRGGPCPPRSPVCTPRSARKCPKLNEEPVAPWAGVGVRVRAWRADGDLKGALLIAVPDDQAHAAWVFHVEAAGEDDPRLWPGAPGDVEAGRGLEMAVAPRDPQRRAVGDLEV